MPGERPSSPRRSFAIGITCAVALGGVLSCHSTAPSYIVVDAARAVPDATMPVLDAGVGDTVVNARFHNVHFRMWPGVALDLDDLAGRMRSTRRDRVVSFDDKTSFVLAIDSGTVGLEVSDLARLMNTYVFAYRGAPLRDLSFAVEGQHLVQRGILHKVVDIPFEMVAEVSATAQGEIRVHPLSMKICTIPGQGLMEALGITLAKLLDVHEAKGVRVGGNDMFLDPTRLLPPPAISGHLASVRVEPGKLVQFFGSSPGSTARTPAVEPDSAAPNYMMFRGGTLQFGKLFMVHAEMQVIDLAPSDAFDFDIGRYHEQLVAGYHRTLANDGLLVFMPDVATLGRQAAQRR
jgi:hypothetical protein